MPGIWDVSTNDEEKPYQFTGHECEGEIPKRGKHSPLGRMRVQKFHATRDPAPSRKQHNLITFWTTTNSLNSLDSG